ncbi:MAG: transposase [Gammaproteobacteria bacterium]|nr:transposase [Gammaproteobacteria bacterium]
MARRVAQGCRARLRVGQGVRPVPSRQKRAPEELRHTFEDLGGQRVFGIACGRPDGNDGDRVADDPIHQLLIGRDLVAGDGLASQPTVSRFENNAGRLALHGLGREVALS